MVSWVGDKLFRAGSTQADRAAAFPPYAPIPAFTPDKPRPLPPGGLTLNELPKPVECDPLFCSASVPACLNVQLPVFGVPAITRLEPSSTLWPVVL